MNLIEANDLSFSYRVINNNHGSMKELFRDFLRGKLSIENYLAISNLSFTIKKGKVTAIIGNNGAGKSTLLKIMARVMQPTSGSISINGSIAPMIELGAGFNLELTGRENILFYSSLIGRDINEVKPRILEIAKWAGVTDHLDYQLRTYSTGMIARLAFSVATDQISDLLIVDEILSVGDGEFAIKSKNRMKQIRESGCTLVLVSHDLDSISEMADEVIWLDKGRIKMIGNPGEVITAYQSSGA